MGSQVSGILYELKLGMVGRLFKILKKVSASIIKRAGAIRDHLVSNLEMKGRSQKNLH